MTYTHIPWTHYGMHCTAMWYKNFSIDNFVLQCYNLPTTPNTANAMAKNTDTRKRIAVKWIRDKAKRAYEKQEHCWVCGTTTDLELHHLHSITLLLQRWAKQKNYDVTTDSGILEHRDEFIAEHHNELYNLVYTLCNQHHVMLHRVFGKTPKWNSHHKQQHWLQIQRDKITGVISSAVVAKHSPFLKLLNRE